MHTEERKERQNLDTERHAIPPQPPWFFYVPGIQLRYTGSPFYVPIRQTMMNTVDIYNEKMNDMWEPAPGIEPGLPLERRDVWPLDHRGSHTSEWVQRLKKCSIHKIKIVFVHLEWYMYFKGVNSQMYWIHFHKSESSIFWWEIPLIQLHYSPDTTSL